MQTLRKRVVSIVLAASLLIGGGAAAVVPLSAGAAGTSDTETVHVLDQTKKGDVSGEFFAWEPQNAGAGHGVSAQGGTYTFTRKGHNNASQNLNITVDLTKTPYLYYEIESAKGLKVQLRPSDASGNNGSKMVVAAAAGSGKIKLADVAELQSCITADNKVTFNLFELESGGDATDGDTIVIKKLYFGADSAPSENEDEAKAAAVEALIDALPAVEDIQLSDREQIEEANAAYQCLNVIQKNLVDATKVETLKAAVEKLQQLIYDSQPEVDKRAAKAVDDKIASIGYVMLHKEELIQECRADYEALTAEQKALVTGLATLNAAEEALADLKANPPKENTAKTETFWDKFNDGSFPLAVATSTSSGDSIARVFSTQMEANRGIYAYRFGSELDKSAGIMFKQMTEVDASVTYHFENGLKSLEFVGSYIHASIFRSGTPESFSISWSETLDGTYTTFMASDIAYEREKIDDDYPGMEGDAKGNQWLAFYRIEQIPAQARYIRLNFKGSDPTLNYPYNYENWQVPMGYLKVESYKNTVAMEEDKTLTDDTTGISLEGTLPAEGVLQITDKLGTGVETAAKRYLADKELKNVLGIYHVAVMVGEQPFTDFEGTLRLSFPLQSRADDHVYGILSYDPVADVFTDVPCTVANGRLSIEVTGLGDLVLIGNDAAAGTQGPGEDPGKDPSGDSGKDPEGNMPGTGYSFPIAALLVMAAASGTVALMRKRMGAR